jgi:hypothetical protein
MNSNVLNSWKEIAAYLGRGVRTVQRWEIELGLPVRRPRDKSRSAVIALKAEIDNWLTKSGHAMVDPAENTIAIKESRAALAQNVKRLHQKTQELVERLDALRQAQELVERLDTLQKLATRRPNAARRTTRHSPKR